MELISAVGRTMPVATFVGNNSAGSWFADILETGANYVAPLLQAMPHPIAKGIGTAIQGGNTMMKAWFKKPKAERKAINNNTKAAVQRMSSGGGRPRRQRAPANIARQPARKKQKLAGLGRGKRGRGLAPIRPGYGKAVSNWVTPARGGKVNMRIAELD